MIMRQVSSCWGEPDTSSCKVFQTAEPGQSGIFQPFLRGSLENLKMSPHTMGFHFPLAMGFLKKPNRVEGAFPVPPWGNTGKAPTHHFRGSGNPPSTNLEHFTLTVFHLPAMLTLNHWRDNRSQLIRTRLRARDGFLLPREWREGSGKGGRGDLLRDCPGFP